MSRQKSQGQMNKEGWEKITVFVRCNALLPTLSDLRYGLLWLLEITIREDKQLYLSSFQPEGLHKDMRCMRLTERTQ